MDRMDRMDRMDGWMDGGEIVEQEADFECVL
jgi:hypothetical protein